MNGSFYNTNQTIDYLKSKGPENWRDPMETKTYGKIGIGSTSPDTSNFVMDVFGPTRHVCQTFQICTPQHIFTATDNIIKFPYNSNSLSNYPPAPVSILPLPDIVADVIQDVQNGINNLLKPSGFNSLLGDGSAICDFSNNITYIICESGDFFNIYSINGVYKLSTINIESNGNIILSIKDIYNQDYGKCDITNIKSQGPNTFIIFNTIDPYNPPKTVNLNIKAISTGFIEIIKNPGLLNLKFSEVIRKNISVPMIFSVLGDSLFQGNIFISGQFINSSDERIKRDIQPYNIELSLDKINKLRVVSYREIDDKFRQKHIGFIAQELDKVLPESVKKNEKKFIPDIYKNVNCSWNNDKKYIEIDNSEFNFNFMERIQIIDDEDIKFIISVIDTEDDKAKLYSDSFLEKEPNLKSNKVLLYGREIHDFHRIDKNMIFSVCVGAVQELSKKVNLLEEKVLENKNLEEKVLKLEKLIETLINNKKEEKIIEIKPRKTRVKKENK